MPVRGTIASDSASSESRFQTLLVIHWNGSQLLRFAVVESYIRHLLNSRFTASLVSHLSAFATAQGKCISKALFPQRDSDLVFQSFETRLSVSVSLAGSSAMIINNSSSPSATKGSRRSCSCGLGTILGASSLVALFPCSACCSARCSAFHHQPPLRLTGGTYGMSCVRNVSDKGTLRCSSFWRFADIVRMAGLQQVKKSSDLLEGPRGDCSGISLCLILALVNRVMTTGQHNRAFGDLTLQRRQMKKRGLVLMSRLDQILMSCPRRSLTIQS